MTAFHEKYMTSLNLLKPTDKILIVTKQEFIFAFDEKTKTSLKFLFKQ